MVAVVAQRQLVPAFHQGEPEILVDALQNPDVVVGQPIGEGEGECPNGNDEHHVDPLKFPALGQRQRFGGAAAEILPSDEIGEERRERLRLQDGLVQEVDREEAGYQPRQGAKPIQGVVVDEMATHTHAHPKHAVAATEMHEPETQRPNRHERHGDVVAHSLHGEHGEQVGNQADRDEYRDRGDQPGSLPPSLRTDSDPACGGHQRDAT